MLHPVYYIIMFFITYFSYMEVSNPHNVKKYTKTPYIIVIIALILVAGTRVKQGPDFIPYLMLYFSSNQHVPWDQVFNSNELAVEPTYIIISKVLGFLRMPFFALLLTYATISLSMKSYTFYKFSPYPFLTLLIYYLPFFFIQEMGHIRQGASIACCLFSYQFIVKRKLFYYLIFVLLAYYFHKSSIIFLPAYWIANYYLSTIQAIILIGISIIISPFQPYNWFGSLFSSVSADTLADAINSYQELDKLGFSTGDIVKIIFILIIFLFDKRNLQTNPDPNYIKIRNLLLTHFCIYYAFRENMIFATRLAESYNAFLGILLALIIKNSRSSFIKMGLYLYIVAYLYLFSIRFWENSKKAGFDKFNNIFSGTYNNQLYTPQEFAD